MQIPSAVLKAAAQFASKDRTRPALRGVNVTPDRRVCATDGHRMFLVTLPEAAGNGLAAPVTIPSETVALALKAIPKWPAVAELAADSIDCITAKVPYQTLDTFPLVEKVIPSGEPQFTITLGANLLADTLKALASLAGKGNGADGVRFTFYNTTGAVKLEATTADGLDVLALVMPMRDKSDYRGVQS